MLYGKKYKHNKKVGSKDNKDEKLGHKNQHHMNNGINHFKSSNNIPYIPETNVISHEDGLFFLPHRMKDNSHSVHNLNRGKKICISI